MKTVIPFLFAMVWWYDSAGCFDGVFPPWRMSFKQAEAFISGMELAPSTIWSHPVIKPDWEITPFYGVTKETACGAANIST
jgi:hypothetical protein